MEPAVLCVIFFSLGTAVDLGGIFFPAFRQHIMNYGSRSTSSQPEPTTKSPRKTTTSISDYMASIKVPHTWFLHYYITSVASSLFWAVQILTHGLVFKLFALYSPHPTTGTMTVNQVFLVWLLMAIQGMRRLYESLTLTKPSQSKMWVGLWALGIAYYIFMGISIWIEGIAALDVNSPPISLLEISKPSLKTVVAVSIFIIASLSQHSFHVHLAGLKKYTLPNHPIFQFIICPHYTSECMIYVALAIAAAPKDQILNKTVLAGLCFVVSNLAVTADSTKKWYIEKFGAEKVKGRWRMVPFVY